MDWSPSTEIKETRRTCEPMLTYRREVGEVHESLGAEAGHQRTSQPYLPKQNWENN